MPTGQKTEPKVQIVRDDRGKVATVTVTLPPPKYLTPSVEIHSAKDGGRTNVVITNVAEQPAAPTVTFVPKEDGGPETVTVSGVCLERCLDEPGRVSDQHIEAHVMKMAVIALEDAIAAHVADDGVIDAEEERLLASLAKKRASRPEIVREG